MPVIRMLRSAPEAVKADEYALSEARGWLARMLKLGRKSSKRSPEEELLELERQVARGKLNGAEGSARALPKNGESSDEAAKAAKLAEIRALVDESLSS